VRLKYEATKCNKNSRKYDSDNSDHDGGIVVLLPLQQFVQRQQKFAELLQITFQLLQLLRVKMFNNEYKIHTMGLVENIQSVVAPP